MFTEIKNTLRNLKPTSNELRIFGSILALVVTVGIRLRGGDKILYLVPAFLTLTALFLPRAIAPIQRTLLILALPIGFIISRVILTLAFYLIITPIALFMRLMKRPPIELTIDPTAQTYWENIDTR